MMGTWVDIKTRKPPEGQQVLVACMNARGSKIANIGYFSRGIFHGTGTSAKVMYWMPIELPKMEVEKK